MEYSIALDMGMSENIVCLYYEFLFVFYVNMKVVTS